MELDALFTEKYSMKSHKTVLKMLNIHVCESEYSNTVFLSGLLRYM